MKVASAWKHQKSIMLSEANVMCVEGMFLREEEIEI